VVQNWVTFGLMGKRFFNFIIYFNCKWVSTLWQSYYNKTQHTSHKITQRSNETQHTNLRTQYTPYTKWINVV
jgi:hypothetical protein